MMKMKLPKMRWKISLMISKDDIKLDRTIFGHFDRWFQANVVRDRYSFFFKCFQQGDMFRFIIKKRSRKK